MILLRNISKSYFTKSIRADALKNLNLELPNKGIIFITEKNKLNT